MNYLNKRLPKVIVYIILDYAKDVDKFNKVIGEYEYKMRQVSINLPKNIWFDAYNYDRYMVPEEFVNFLLTYENGVKHIKSTLGNKKLYYFG